MKQELEAICSVELPVGETPPTWIKLMPVGDIHGRDGRRWYLDDPTTVISTSTTRAAGTDLPIDFEHQTDYSAANGQPAPAAGWIKELTARDAGIWARVEWTARAADYIQKREYRYISPTFYHTKDGRVTLIARAALTNTPALELPALARQQEEDGMKQNLVDKILTKLGLTADAPEADVDKALLNIDEMSQCQAQFPKLAVAMGLEKDAGGDDLIARATVLANETPNPGEYVPRPEFDKVAQQLTNLQTEQTEAKATAAVDAAVTAGKITPATRDWALSYASSDPEGFSKYIEAAPVILSSDEGNKERLKTGPGAGLTSEELSVCNAMGITPDQFKKANEAEVAHG